MQAHEQHSTQERPNPMQKIASGFPSSTDRDHLSCGRNVRKFPGDLLPFLYGLAALAVGFACTAWAVAMLSSLAPPAPMSECPNGTRLYAKAVGASRITIPVFHCFDDEDRADVGNAGSYYQRGHGLQPIDGPPLSP